INKIDLPNADVASVHRQLEEILAIPSEEAIEASAKMGIGIEEILEAIVKRIPPPQKPADETLRALVFDSVFDVYRGVVGYVRVVSGTMEANYAIRLLSNNSRYEIKEVGVFTPKMLMQPRLEAGDVGYFIANIKSTADVKIGDTITDQRQPAREPLPGFQEIHPMVFSGIYPINTADFEHLKAAIAKLRLNDAAFVYTPESSVALGFGFRCGFLGLLHMEIIQERLRFDGLQARRLSPSEAGQARPTREWRTGRCVFDHCPQGPGRGEGTAIGGEVKGGHSTPALSSGNTGRHRRQNYRARERFGLAKKRNRKMLRRRYHSKAETAGETKRRKETDEKHRKNQYSTRGVYRSAESAMRIEKANVEHPIPNVQHRTVSVRRWALNPASNI